MMDNFSAVISTTVDFLFALPELIFLEIFQHVIFLASLLICFLSKFLARHFLTMIWIYILFSEILHDRDRSKPCKRGRFAPIEAYSDRWYILSSYQLNHMWSTPHCNLFNKVTYRFCPWNELISEHLYRIQTFAYPVAPPGFLTDLIQFFLSTFELGICLFFSLLDFLWIINTFLYTVVYKLSATVIISFLNDLTRFHKDFSNVRVLKQPKLLHDKNLYCFASTSAYNSDHDAIKRCYDACSNEDNRKRVSFFTSDPDRVYVDNCANTHITNNKNHFVDFRPIHRGSRDKVSTVGGNAIPAGEGTVRWAWRDDDGRSHMFLLKNCRYYPNSPACILSPSQLGISLKDEDGGTGIDSTVRWSTFYWNKKKHSKTIHHTSAFMPQLEINDTATNLSTFLSSFEAYFDDFPQFSFLTMNEFNNTFKSQENTLSTLGRRIIYRKNGNTDKGIIVGIDPNQMFTIRLNNNSEITTTHDFLQFDEDTSNDSGCLPEPALQEIEDRLKVDPSSCPSINSPLSNEQRELLRWHIRLGHLPFKILRQFAELGLIPKHLAKVSVFPICACCAFANATKRAWRTKQTSRSIRSDNKNFPGGCVSVDQLVSGQTGMIPQSSGNKVQARYVGATIFVDNFSRFSYVHFMTSLNTDQTLDAKLAFERIAHGHGVMINRTVRITVDLPILLSKTTVKNENKNSPFAELEHITRTILPNGISVL